jgi:hypothetical protein
MLVQNADLQSASQTTYRTEAGAAAAAARDAIRASGMQPEAARNAFLEVQRYATCAVEGALAPTPAAVRAARVWRETSKAGATSTRAQDRPTSSVEVRGEGRIF